MGIAEDDRNTELPRIVSGIPAIHEGALAFVSFFFALARRPAHSQAFGLVSDM